MMKIGIMSMQRIRNYGSFLQAYGLKKIIESMGNEVEFVDYHVEPCVAETIKIKRDVKYEIKRAVSYFAHRNTRKKRKMYREAKRFNDIYDENLQLLGINRSGNYNAKVDVLVIGSDEVFNCLQDNQSVGFSPELFGKNANALKCISYAASFGNTTLERLREFGKDREIASYLNDLSAVSVRDSNSYSIVKQLTGCDPEENLDPVLMYEFSSEVPVIQERNYIAVYAYRGRITEKEGAIIKKYAKENKKKLIALGGVLPFCDAYIVASPFEVMGYIKAADAVITDTFHGTIFSIKYNKPFAAIIRESNQQKLSDLLKRFDLLNRSVCRIGDITNIFMNQIDWEPVNKKIEKERLHTTQYLMRNLYDREK